VDAEKTDYHPESLRRRVRRPRQLEDENPRLKRFVADLTLDNHMLSEALRTNG